MPAGPWGQSIDLARGFIACWTRDGPLDQCLEWARQLRDELDRVIDAEENSP